MDPTVLIQLLMCMNTAVDILVFASALCLEGLRYGDTRTVSRNVVFVTVLSDEALPHVLDAGVCVQHIVHYDMPSTKTEFRSRLALFYTAMKWYVKITATPGL